VIEEKMGVAVRVLTAINKRVPLDPSDVASLRAWYSDKSDCEIDELVCSVIDEALQQKSC